MTDLAPFMDFFLVYYLIFFKSKERKKRSRPKKMEKKLESFFGGLNAMPFGTEARKCNHCATGRLLEFGNKVNATYMRIKCSCY